MKTLYIEIEFEEEDRQAIGKVTTALQEYNISHVSWRKPEKPAAFTHRSAATVRDNLGSS